MFCGAASLDAGLRLFQVGQEGHVIVAPFPEQIGLVGKLAAGDLHGDLHGTTVEVVEVLCWMATK